MKKQISILVCEDEKFNYILLKKLLELIIGSSLVVHYAKNGEEAIAFCNEDIDLVLMDVEMPIINGFEATKILKIKYPNLPIILQTAHCSQEYKTKAQTIGCDDFLAKPIVRKDFEKLLSHYLKIDL